MKPPNDALVGLADWNIPGWSRGLDHFNLNGTLSDYRELGVFLRHIEEVGLPFLHAMSSWTAAAERLISERWSFHRAADFFMVANRPDRASDALREGLRLYESGEYFDQSREIDKIKARLARYFTHC